MLDRDAGVLYPVEETIKGIVEAMEYRKTITLKDGRECVLRSGTAADAQAVLDNFILTHGQTDNLTSYPDECSFTLEQEEKFLQSKAESPDEIELIAVVGSRVAGTAGVDRVGRYDKVKHRASFGISIDREFWGLGIGRALTEACIECARKAGYLQLELDAVEANERALALYRSVGFREYGRNPRGFRSRRSGWQPIVLMYLDLSDGQTRGETISMKTIYFAGGCFWGTQKFFDQFDGVVKTEVGYANGPGGAPSYSDVCLGIGHAETVRVDYDEARISLTQLLDYYFLTIDPLSVDHQGGDYGRQYRTGVYYTEEAQLAEIRPVFDRVREKAGAPLAVELEPIENFYPAEDYHQKYLDKNPGGYCHIPQRLLSLAKDEKAGGEGA